MERHCVITLCNPTTKETRQLTWKLEQNSVVDRWVQLINTANEHGPSIEYTTWGMYDDPESIVDVLVSINTSIVWFNENNHHDFSIPTLTREHTNRTTLNSTHAEFEKYALMFLPVNQIGHGPSPELLPCDLTEMAKHLGNINQCVHAMEKILEINPVYVCASFSTYVMNSEGLPHEVALEEEDYSLFTLGYEFGDLMLGYATTGKSLFHLFKDNNLDLLQSGGHASPQRVISTNLLGMFYEGTLDHFERNPYHQWFDEKNLASYGYSKTDPKNAIGNIILGHLVRAPDTLTLSRREFIRLHTSFSQIVSVVISS